jgi:hypothetical protein
VKFNVNEGTITKKTALGETVQQLTIYPNKDEPYKDPVPFFIDVKEDLTKIVKKFKSFVKVEMVLKYDVKKIDPETEEVDYNISHARTGFKKLNNGSEFENVYVDMVENMLEKISKFQNKESGWMFHSIKELNLFIVKFQPIHGNGSDTLLPSKISDKKTVINMKNKDNECFKWAVGRVLNPTQEHGERITKLLREQSKDYKWDSITFPTKLKDIQKWEKDNNIGVNVFGFDEEMERVFTLKLSSLFGKNNRIINLYLHDDLHYCPITDFFQHK